MKLTKKEVQHVALLARMKISEDETETFAKQLSTILNYVAQLQELNTDGVEETAQIAGLENITRLDEVKISPSHTRERILKNAPEIEDDLFKTKSVF